MTEKLDVYSRVTGKIIADLERGNLTWLQPWQAGHQAGPVSRPLRAAGKAYRGVNVLMLWATTAVRPRSARHPGAICNRACSLKQGRAAHEGSAPAACAACEELKTFAAGRDLTE